MARSDYILPMVLGCIYVVLVGFLSNITVTWGEFVSSNDFWGRSNARTIAYMQIYHSIGVGLAALPVALAIAWRYKVDWFRPAGIAAIIGSSYMLFDQIRGGWLLSQHELAPETYHIVSGAIDVLKTGLILLLLTAVLARLYVVSVKAR